FSAGDAERAGLRIRILREIGFRTDARRDDVADDRLLEEGVVLLDLRDERVLRDGTPERDDRDDRQDHHQDEYERTCRGARSGWTVRGCPRRHQRARCARKSSRRTVAAPLSRSVAPRRAASVEV